MHPAMSASRTIFSTIPVSGHATPMMKETARAASTNVISNRNRSTKVITSGPCWTGGSVPAQPGPEVEGARQTRCGEREHPRGRGRLALAYADRAVGSGRQGLLFTGRTGQRDAQPENQ